MKGSKFKEQCAWLRAYISKSNPSEVLRQVRVLSTGGDKPTLMLRGSNGSATCTVMVGPATVPDIDFCVEWNGVNAVARACQKDQDVQLIDDKYSLVIHTGTDSVTKLEAHSSQGFADGEQALGQSQNYIELAAWVPEHIRSLAHSALSDQSDPVLSVVSLRGHYAYTWRHKSLTRIEFPYVSKTGIYLFNNDFQIIRQRPEGAIDVLDNSVMFGFKDAWVEMPIVPIKSRHALKLEKQCAEALGNGKYTIELRTKDILAAVNRTQQAAGVVHVKLRFHKHKLAITAEDKKDTVKHRESVACESPIKASGMTRVEDLRSCLRAMRNEKIEFRVPDLSKGPAHYLTITDGSVLELLTMKPDATLTEDK